MTNSFVVILVTAICRIIIQVISVFILVTICFLSCFLFQLTLDSDLFTDMGLDSLDHVEVMMAIEDDFRKNIISFIKL